MIYTENCIELIANGVFADNESGELLAMVLGEFERVSKAEICQRVEEIFGYFIIYGW
jgi:hypothetical protein